MNRHDSTITFYKMSGSGNDFILVDNRTAMLDADSLGPFVASICRRKHSVGADGMILLETSDRADFKWERGDYHRVAGDRKDRAYQGWGAHEIRLL